MQIEATISAVNEAAKVVGTTWPLYSFVTSNPLSGYESTSFEKACVEAYLRTGNSPYPESSFFRNAIRDHLITEHDLQHLLNTHQIPGTLEDFFEELDHFQNTSTVNSNHQVDKILVKWLSVFLDEGLASWQMPGKQQGFYKAWRNLAKYDQDLKLPKDLTLPKSSLEVINQLTGDLPKATQQELFESHFTALPGWVGYIKYRKDQQTQWQEAYPLNLEDYLAVRLLITDVLGMDIRPKSSPVKQHMNMLKLIHECLSLVEEAWQSHLLKKLSLKNQSRTEKNNPDAQLVFCIDTRSELIRRNIEDKGNYETFGYAGFFGIAMDYETPFSQISKKSCPPILDSAYKVSEKEKQSKSKDFASLHKKYAQHSFKNYFLRRMKNILPSAFGYVEGAGLVYGVQLIKRSFNLWGEKPGRKDSGSEIESICDTEIHKASDSEALKVEEQSLIVKSAFELMGWKKFAPLVVFAGHGSHTSNNPFASSLDCGACAASPGRHNARMMARLANSKEVQQVLKQKHGIDIPEDTYFLAAEHNTTTDEITLFDADAPGQFQEHIQRLQSDLKKAQSTATAERLGDYKSVERAYRKSTDWSETRPEWGLAKNAGFIIGSRRLTEQSNLEGECFLHSYDWKTDQNAEALNAILNGPMVVTQWINTHYYFSTVDNQSFGGGSKITHNIVGKFGVVQGNGGDLKVGLPLQSVKMSDTENYHQPQRLSVYVEAPQGRLEQLLKANPHLKQLIENQWIHLLVIDPEKNNQVLRYTGKLSWESLNLKSRSKTHGFVKA